MLEPQHDKPPGDQRDAKDNECFHHNGLPHLLASSAFLFTEAPAAKSLRRTVRILGSPALVAEDKSVGSVDASSARLEIYHPQSMKSYGHAKNNFRFVDTAFYLRSGHGSNERAGRYHSNKPRNGWRAPVGRWCSSCRNNG
jgi:hypothetical protein